MSNKAAGTSWDDYKKDYMSEEERQALRLRKEIILALIDARESKGMSQRDLEIVSGVKQPMIARIEKGYSSPTLSTIMKLLAPLGKTLVVADIH